MDDPVEVQPQPTTISSIKAVGIGLAILAVVSGPGNYYLTADEPVNGREMHGALTTFELDSVKGKLKQIFSGTNPTPTINQEFALEDVVRYNCPQGFGIANFNGKFTTAQLQGFIDGNCQQ